MRSLADLEELFWVRIELVYGLGVALNAEVKGVCDMKVQESAWSLFLWLIS